MVKRINIAASDLAKLTGDNKFDPVSKIVGKILSSNKIENIYIPKSNLEEKLLSLPEEELAKIREELQIPKTNVLDMVSAINKKYVSESYSTKLTEEESKQKLDSKMTDTMQQLNTCIKHDLRMRRGNFRENKLTEYRLNMQSVKRLVIVTQNFSKRYYIQIQRVCLISIFVGRLMVFAVMELLR